MKKKFVWIFALILSFFIAGCGTVTEEQEGSASKETSDLIPAMTSSWVDQPYLPSTGEVKIPVFVVDFSDVTYADTVLTKDDFYDSVFGTSDENSVHSFFENSSYGNLDLTGDVYTYTSEKKITDYEYVNNSEDEGVELLLMEVMDAFDNEVDFSQYDANGDGAMDAFVLCIPTGGDEDYWWGSQHTWYCNETYTVDGVSPAMFVVCDSQADENDLLYFQHTLDHELGHCMGLTDYYYYESTSDDDEGFHGIAGYEIMDEMDCDFSQFSKLQLGWLRQDQVQTCDTSVTKQTFTIPEASSGGCLVIYKESDDTADFQSEYFLVEYNRPTGYFKGYFDENQSGIRIFHIEAELINDYYYEYKYDEFSDYYDDGAIRVIRRVNDDGDFLRAGEEISYGEDDLVWYDDTASYSLTISVDALREGEAVVTVTN